MSTLVLFSCVGGTMAAMPTFKGFLQASNFTTESIEAEILADLAGRRDDAFEVSTDQSEAVLRPIYATLPKSPSGTVDYAAARYALHRMFVRRYGWNIRGLDSQGESEEAVIRPFDAWVPSHIHAALKRTLGRGGFQLRELAAMAAALEHVARQEADARLEAVYRFYGLSPTALLGKEAAAEILSMYMIVFRRGGNFTPYSLEDAVSKLYTFQSRYKRWDALSTWMQGVESKMMGTGSVNFETQLRVAEAFAFSYASFDAQECRMLKDTLVGIEGDLPGRVPLSSFYNKSRAKDTSFVFMEKKEWLQELGALDTSDPAKPSVILTNYVYSTPQCLQASALYVICCRNECEDLLGYLEGEIAEPTAMPEQIIELVQTMPSTTVAAPRVLPSRLRERLFSVANGSGGRVPLHGRLFAQWMHHAFPRECPFPHPSDGRSSPRTPDEWMQETGHESTQASEEEMTCHISGPCWGGPTGIEASGLAVTIGEHRIPMPAELPWSDEEELFALRSVASKVDTGTVPTKAIFSDVRGKKLMRIFSQLGMVFGFTAAVASAYTNCVRATGRSSKGTSTTRGKFACAPSQKQEPFRI